jgi:hypothetical protein
VLREHPLDEPAAVESRWTAAAVHVRNAPL